MMCSGPVTLAARLLAAGSDFTAGGCDRDAVAGVRATVARRVFRVDPPSSVCGVTAAYCWNCGQNAAAGAADPPMMTAAVAVVARIWPVKRTVATPCLLRLDPRSNGTQVHNRLEA